MLNKILKFTFTQNLNNLAFRSLIKKESVPVFSDQLPKDKLNALADVIKSLSNI